MCFTQRYDLILSVLMFMYVHCSRVRVSYCKVRVLYYTGCLRYDIVIILYIFRHVVVNICLTYRDIGRRSHRVQNWGWVSLGRAL